MDQILSVVTIFKQMKLKKHFRNINLVSTIEAILLSIVFVYPAIPLSLSAQETQPKVENISAENDLPSYFIYILLLAILLFIGYYYSRRWKRLKEKLEREKLEKEKIIELNLLESRFVTNISHEFRSSLSLIIGPLENILTEGNQDRKTTGHLKLMHRNAGRLLHRINQLTDFRKIENSEMKLQTKPADIIKFIKRITYFFDEPAKQKDIDFYIESQLDSLNVYFDHDKLDKILYNLLSNAFKVTPNGGKIHIKIARQNNCVYMTVNDSGKEIEKQDLDKVFDRLYQREGQTEIGMGLFLCKKLTELHQGEISVKSKPGEGSSFTVKLPLGKAHLKESQIVCSTEEKSFKPIALLEEEPETEEKKNPKNLPLVLVVEDNVALRNFIKYSIESHFRVVEADNGIIALKLAKEQHPALIISDVIMPEMDGIELCKKLKSDDVFSHIPIILLTALSSVEDVFSGYKSGADDCIPKPFNTQLLILRSTNLIEKGKKLKKRFQREIQLQPKDITITSSDEKLLKKIMKVIEKNMVNPDFTVEKMGAEIGISRVHLNRKIKALTDQTAVDFIRTIRMKQAAKLLKRKKFNISEVAYAVGFSNPISFSRSFKKQFGRTPSHFAEES